MVAVNLQEYFSGHVFAFVLVFTRLGAALMLFPGIGENFVPPRVRLLLSLAIAFIVFLPLQPMLPAMPATTGGLFLLIFRETLVGVFFGFLLRLFISITETAGAVVAMQLGLSNAMILNPSQASQSALTSALFSTTAMVLIFVTGLDHMLLRGLLDTYRLFPPGQFIEPGDMLQSYAHLTSETFAIGVELAAPLLVIGLILYALLGFMQRLMPQVQIFLVMLPLQIWGGLFILSLSLVAIMTVWLRYFDNAFGTLFVR